MKFAAFLVGATGAGAFVRCGLARYCFDSAITHGHVRSETFASQKKRAAVGGPDLLVFVAVRNRLLRDRHQVAGCGRGAATTAYGSAALGYELHPERILEPVHRRGADGAIGTRAIQRPRHDAWR